MTRTFTLLLAAIAAIALFGGLVYAVLVAAHVSEAAAATVYGVTPRRLWATAAAGLALVGVVIGGLAVRRSTDRTGTGNGGLAAVVAGAIGAGEGLGNGEAGVVAAAAGRGACAGRGRAGAGVVVGVWADAESANAISGKSATSSANMPKRN